MAFFLGLDFSSLQVDQIRFNEVNQKLLSVGNRTPVFRVSSEILTTILAELISAIQSDSDRMLLWRLFSLRSPTAELGFYQSRYLF